MTNEEWKEIVDFEDYKISNRGRVFSTKTNKILSAKPNSIGYVQYYLSKNNVVYPRLAHRLVAMHFIKNPNNYPVINHIDSCRSNNDISNLEWCTISHNATHGVNAQFNRGELANSAGIDAIQALTIMTCLKNPLITYVDIFTSMGHANNSAVASIAIGRTWKRLGSIIGFEHYPKRITKKVPLKKDIDYINNKIVRTRERQIKQQVENMENETKRPD